MPLLIENNKEKKIFNVHSINTLFINFLNFLEDNKKYILATCETNWFDIPDEIPQLIEIIEEFDKNSTMFRYPITMNKDFDYRKTPLKKFTFTQDSGEKIDKSKGSKIILLVENQDNEIVESYVSDDNILTGIHEALKELATQVSGLHFGLKFELTK